MIVTVMDFCTPKWPFFSCTTFGVDAAMARMEPVPGGRMASNCCTPNMPRFEIVNVPTLSASVIITVNIKQKVVNHHILAGSCIQISKLRFELDAIYKIYVYVNRQILGRATCMD